MQKGFIFLLIIWNSSPFASGNNQNDLQFSLGCQAVIPCPHNRSDSNSFKWFYKKDEHTRQIYFQDKTGVQHYHNLLRPRMKVASNRSLVIDNFTEGDQGNYWCENCFHKDCWDKPHTVVTIKKEILEETHETIYVAAGRNFTHACPGLTTNFLWTFEANYIPALKTSNHSLYQISSETFIHIVNVTRANAGKYTCWKTGCNGHRWRLLTINLCVVTVHNSKDSSVSCAVMCDTEFSNNNGNNSTLNKDIGTGTISVLIDPNGSLNCTAKQMFDGYSAVNSTHGPSNASNKTTDEPEYLIPVIYGTSATLSCLILMALLNCCLGPRLRAAFHVHFSSSGLNGRGEDETSVVYTSVVFRKSANTTNNFMTYSDSCVYSELKV